MLLINCSPTPTSPDAVSQNYGLYPDAHHAVWCKLVWCSVGIRQWWGCCYADYVRHSIVAYGASNWMKVNASGVLTRPQTPCMIGQLTGLGNPYNAGGTPLKITADTNVGGCWNNATGLFTCPVAGYYMMTAGGIAATQAGYIYIQKNGGDQYFTHWNHTANWHWVSLSAIMPFAAGDTISWYLTGLTPSTTGFYGVGGHSMYSIALMV